MTYNINSVESSSVTDMFEEDNFDLLTQSSELPGPSVPEVPIANCNPPPPPSGCKEAQSKYSGHPKDATGGPGLGEEKN